MINAVRFHSLAEEGEGKMEDYDVADMVSKRIVRMSDHHFLEVLNIKGNALYQYSSGHFCIDAVFKYYATAHSLKMNYDDQLMDNIDFDQNNFTSPERLVKTVQRILKSEEMSSYSRLFGIIMQENMNNSIIERCIDQEMPIVMLVNNGHSKNGYYVIAIGYDQENYYFLDPN